MRPGRVVTLLAALGTIGLLLLLSENKNVKSGGVKRHRLRVDPHKSIAATQLPMVTWAQGPELHNDATAAAISGALDVPPFGPGVGKVDADGAAPAVTAGAVAIPPRAQQQKLAIACAPGCEKHGVCNTELGRCDCPPFIGGAACDKPLFPACAAAVGLTVLAPAPCVYDQMSNNAPVSCECLMGCEAMGLMGVRECYVTDASNRTVMSWVQSQIHLRGLAPNREFYEAHLKLAHAESVRECGGRGVFAPRMPNEGAGPAQARKHCRCYPGFTGGKCESTTHDRQLRACINGCSARGKCVRNWCHCDAGFYGTDCSLGKSAAGDGAGAALPAPIGAQRDAGAPRVYIYDLPPRFNGWMHAGDAGWWQDFDLWGEDVIIHRRALRSYYRVDDPEKADYFLVPVWDSSAMWQMNWGFRDLLPTGVRVVGEAAQYVREHWPYFDRRGGTDHLWVFGHDQGGWRIRQKLPLIEKGIFISPFGGGPAQRGGHIAGQDIVCPSVLYSGVPTGLINHARRKKVAPQNLAFFQGKLNLHIPYEYSFGVRQGLYKAHRNTPRIVVKEGHEANRETYFENMCGSKFCVAAAGFGFSTRAYEAATAGCVPLIMQDGIEQAYEELLPWFLFSLRLNNSLAQISNLADTLEKVPEARVRAMRSKLYCVWPRFLWIRHDEGATTPLPGASRLLNYDAFESIFWTLRKRLRGDIVWPSDWDEGCREVSRYFASRPLGSREWAPWANYDFDAPAAPAQ